MITRGVFWWSSGWDRSCCRWSVIRLAPTPASSRRWGTVIAAVGLITVLFGSRPRIAHPGGHRYDGI